MKKHDELRGILERYGNPEFGDAIVDEICELFGYPTTIDVERDEQNENLIGRKVKLTIRGVDSVNKVNSAPRQNAYTGVVVGRSENDWLVAIDQEVETFKRSTFCPGVVSDRKNLIHLNKTKFTITG